MVSVVSAGLLATGLVPGFTAGAGAAPACTAAGNTGLTAKVVMRAGQHFSGPVDATGCDVGIFVGPNAAGASVIGATVTGAKWHGILAVDTRNVTVARNTVTASGSYVLPDGEDKELKAIQFDGVSDSVITGNTVTGNSGGGIAVTDDGPTAPPGTPTGPDRAVPAKNVTVTGNRISDNTGGCGIVVAAYNATVGRVDVINNTVTATSVGTFPPVIGQIVVAADAPNTTIDTVNVVHNTVTGSALPGVIVATNAPGDLVTAVRLTANRISDNDWLVGAGPDHTAGVGLRAAPQTTISDTVLTANRISGQFYGVWATPGVTGTVLHANQITVTAGGIPVFFIP